VEKLHGGEVYDPKNTPHDDGPHDAIAPIVQSGLMLA